MLRSHKQHKTILSHSKLSQEQGSPGPSLQTRPHHTLLYILTVDNQPHAWFRCMQRAAFDALGLRQGFLQVDEWRTLRLAYVFDDGQRQSPQLMLERRHNSGDMLFVPAGLTCLGKIIASIRHAATTKFNALVLSDDECARHCKHIAHAVHTPIDATRRIVEREWRVSCPQRLHTSAPLGARPGRVGLDRAAHLRPFLVGGGLERAEVGAALHLSSPVSARPPVSDAVAAVRLLELHLLELSARACAHAGTHTTGTVISFASCPAGWSRSGANCGGKVATARHNRGPVRGGPSRP